MMMMMMMMVVVVVVVVLVVVVMMMEVVKVAVMTTTTMTIAMMMSETIFQELISSVTSRSTKQWWNFATLQRPSCMLALFNVNVPYMVAFVMLKSSTMPGW